MNIYLDFQVVQGWVESTTVNPVTVIVHSVRLPGGR